MTTCAWCGATECDSANAFHEFLRRHDLHPWCWSGVDAGWLPLLDKLVADLKALGWNGKIAQIKEKFGALRFYAKDLDEAMHARIAAAAAESTHTCETCGRPGVLGPLPGSDWWFCRCLPHLRAATAERAARRSPRSASTWFDGYCTGVHRLGSAVRQLLAELQVRPAGAVVAAAQVPLPNLGCTLLTLPSGRELQNALAWTLVEAWLAAPPPRSRVAVVSLHPARMTGAERLLAGCAGVPLAAVRTRKLDAAQREAIVRNCGSLRKTSVIVIDGEVALRAALAAVRGLAASGRVDLVIVCSTPDLALAGVERFDAAGVWKAEARADLKRALAELVVLSDELACRVLALAPEPVAGEPTLEEIRQDTEGLRGAVAAGAVLQADGGWELCLPESRTALRADETGLLRRRNSAG